MDQNTSKTGLASLLAFLVITLLAFALSSHAASYAGRVAGIFLSMGFLVSLVAYFQMRLEDREDAEKLETDELSRTGADTNLFETDDSGIFPARRAREQFEKIMVPAFTVGLLILECVAIWLLWKWLRPSFLPPVQDPLMSLALCAMGALVLFLLGKYTAGLARIKEDRLLRPVSSFMLFGAYLMFATGCGLVAAQAGFVSADLYVARVMAVLLALIALETLLGLVLELYRPRVQGKKARVLYESRLVGYLAQPEGIFTTAAHVLDYQFGFKVSETWVYRFFEKALGWLILAQGVILLVSSCFVFIEPTEEALLERMGKPVEGRAVLKPGLHFKLPWPVDKIYRHQTEQLQELLVGGLHNDAEEGHQHDHEEDDVGEQVLVWTVAHAAEEFNMMVASHEDVDPEGSTEADQKVPAVNFLAVSIPVQFKINDLTAWVYHHADAAQLLEDIAYRETVRYLVSVDLFELMASGRSEASRILTDRIQKSVDEVELGAEILFVGLHGIHPPVKVAPAFENVVGAAQEIQSRILEAEAFGMGNLPMARAQAVLQRRQAEAYKLRHAATAQAQADQFSNQLLSYEASPEVFKTRAYLTALVYGSEGVRKFLLTATNTQDVLQIDLQDKLRPDLLDVPVDMPKAKKTEN